MRTAPLNPILLAAVAFSLGCGDQRTPTAPAADRASAGCPIRAGVIVHDEAGLAAALSVAHSGDVIGLASYFTVSSDVNITTAGVTLTCAAPGAGLAALSGVVNLISVAAPNVVVDHLILDGSQATQPYIATYDGVTLFAHDIQFTNNTVTCSPDNSCAVVLGGTGAVITDNHFEAAGAFDGIHVQVNGDNSEFSADGARIERNTVIANTPSVGLRQGGIRTFLTANVVISDNTILGPWANGISPARLTNSVVERNRIEGALSYGIALSRVSGTQALPGDFNNVFRRNRITGSGVAGINSYLGCSNQFIANDLQGNAGNLGMILPDSSGANTIVGDTHAFVIVDHGAYDCNGDGVNDPNTIRGSH